MHAPPTESFSHEVLLYDGLEEFVARSVAFIREGLREDEPVMVAVPGPKVALLQAALAGDADDVAFVDLAEVGRNPARIIPTWQGFVAGGGDRERPRRGIGEPIWAGRSAAELVECQLHESLLNLAFADTPGFRLLCPYDAGALDPAVVHEARRSHPFVLEEDGRSASAHVRGGDDALAPFEAPLPTPPSRTTVLGFDADMLGDVRACVLRGGEQAGLAEGRARHFVLAVHEVAVNSVYHGGGLGVLRLWSEDDHVVCEVRDRGHIQDPLVGRRLQPPEQLGGRGVFIANQLCDLVQVRSSEDGTVVRLSMGQDVPPSGA